MRLKQLIPFLIFGAIAAVLAYTRFVGLDWGFPYPMHPDERNMVIAIEHFTCTEALTFDCLNPDFFAYGQLPLYAAYGMSIVMSLVRAMPVTFETIALSLRILSAVSAILTVYMLYLIIKMFSLPGFFEKIAALILLTFVPVFIQFAHFGTTESWLMFFVSMQLYLAFRFLQQTIDRKRYILFAGIFLGLALGTKVSALLFAVVPLYVIMSETISQRPNRSLLPSLFSLVKIGAFALVFFIISSPYNIINWSGFLGSMNYESGVAIGSYKAFYTRSFEYSIPVLFQMLHIFPYTLGWPLLIMSSLGFVLLPWNKPYNLLRWTLLTLFMVSAFMYAKWTRFLAPVFPVMVLAGILFLLTLTEQIARSLKHELLASIEITAVIILMLCMAIPGIAYLAIYQNPDVRFAASDWIYRNLPTNTDILSETANVVDIPMPNPYTDPELEFTRRLHAISFNFYELGNEPGIDLDLKKYLKEVPYIFVPSRRIFWNHTCYVQDQSSAVRMTSYQSLLTGYQTDRCQKLQDTYPLQNAYYNGLFTGRYEFQKVAEFTSYPRIEFFGFTLIEFPDEAAEETWTVFDHPVIRVYKRI